MSIDDHRLDEALERLDAAVAACVGLSTDQEDNLADAARAVALAGAAQVEEITRLRQLVDQWTQQAAAISLARDQLALGGAIDDLRREVQYQATAAEILRADLRAARVRASRASKLLEASRRALAATKGAQQHATAPTSDEVAPTRPATLCPECGVGVDVDAAGNCATCGSSATGAFARAGIVYQIAVTDTDVFYVHVSRKTM